MTGRVLVTLLIMFFMCMYLHVGVYNHSTFISFNLIQYLCLLLSLGRRKWKQRKEIGKGRFASLVPKKNERVSWSQHSGLYRWDTIYRKDRPISRKNGIVSYNRMKATSILNEWRGKVTFTQGYPIPVKSKSYFPFIHEQSVGQAFYIS